MTTLRVPRYIFEDIAEGAVMEIREDYNDGYQNYIGLVGSESSFREFLIHLTAEAIEDKGLGIKTGDIVRLSDRVGINNMGRDDLIFYWSPNFLTLTEG